MAISVECHKLNEILLTVGRKASLSSWKHLSGGNEGVGQKRRKKSVAELYGSVYRGESSYPREASISVHVA